MATDNKPTTVMSIDDALKLIKEMSASNKEFAEILAAKIAHPEPTDDERKRTMEAWREKEEMAREQEASRADKRRHCSYPASPHLPHRRSGSQWGMFNGQSVIAWQFIRLTSKDPETGRSRESNAFPVGVCMWCGSEFKPGDADYQDALAWGVNAAAGQADMNIRTGNWVNG